KERKAAEADTDDGPDELFVDRALVDTRALHGLIRRRNRVVDEGIHLLDPLLLDEVRRIEALHLGGDLRRIVSRVEAGDAGDAALSMNHGLPGGRGVEANGRHRPN